MERVGTLINKLNEQFEQRADSSKLLLTAQMLLAELQQNNSTVVSGKVSVLMPVISIVKAEEKQVEILPAVEPIAEVVAEPEVRNEEPVEVEEQSTFVAPSIKQPEHTGWLFDPVVADVPTLAHQEVKEVYELNTAAIIADEPESHNEKLREEKIEVATVLQGSPVKDLKKAIGINDRYLFINELFRGDENMYERSIKTINSFNIYPEAEYWIQREMKTKLGWIDDNETVKLFDQLVKRRFS